MKVWVFRSRKDYIDLYYDFDAARDAQDKDNCCTIEDHIRDGREVGGSKEEGVFYIDDGGSIELMEVR